MCTIFKVFAEFVTTLLLLYVLVFWPRGTRRILTPRAGSEPTPPALEGEALTPGSPEGSLIGKFYHVSPLLGSPGGLGSHLG